MVDHVDTVLNAHFHRVPRPSVATEPFPVLMRLVHTGCRLLVGEIAIVSGTSLGDLVTYQFGVTRTIALYGLRDAPLTSSPDIDSLI